MTIQRLLLWLDTRRLAVAILFVGLFAMAVRTPAEEQLLRRIEALLAQSGAAGHELSSPTASNLARRLEQLLASSPLAPPSSF